MAARKTTTTRRTTEKTTSAPAKCPGCDGTGATATRVRVGRGRRRTDHQQTVLCLSCLGTGLARSF
ncbi:hypothetical protein ACFRNT_37020 [Streptomyces sp. NPDC056697]|uniref:hypothetical protein n=1 Tax=Streptomyces sp. NPDC056697 TaxID=3345915 RepID=UPI00368C1AA1